MIVNHLGLKLRVAFDLFARDQPGFEDRLIVINVREKLVDRRHALRQAALQIRPVLGRDDARDYVGGNQSLGAASLTVHRECDADAAEQQIRLRPTLRE